MYVYACRVTYCCLPHFSSIIEEISWETAKGQVLFITHSFVDVCEFDQDQPGEGEKG